MSFSLREATEEERRATITNNYVEWGKHLTLEQYFEREEELREISQDTLRTWVLTFDGRIVAQCETYTRQVDIYHNEDVSPEVKHVEGFGFGVASVFVPAHERKKGYGTILMRELYGALMAEGALISYLYSDIGKTFYDRLGWRLMVTQDVVSKIPVNFTTELDDGTRAISRSGVEAFLELDNVSTLSELSARSSTSKTFVKMRCTGRIIDWLRRRSEIYALAIPTFQSVDMNSRPFGYSFNDSWILFFHDFKSNMLYTLRHQIKSKEAYVQLLRAAMSEAAICKLSVFTIWDPSLELTALVTDVEFLNMFPGVAISLVDREEELSSMALYRENVGISTGSNITWLANEKFSWI